MARTTADTGGAGIRDYVGMDQNGSLVSEDMAIPGQSYEPVFDMQAAAGPGAASTRGGTIAADGIPVDAVVYNQNFTPEANAQMSDIHAYDTGLIYQGGSAAVPEGWVPQARSGAMPDFFEPERQDMAERKKGLIRDEEAIRLHESDIQREYLRRRELEARQETLEQEFRLAQIEEDVQMQRNQLDEDMAKQRALIDKGLNPFAALSATGNNAGGQISAALSMSAAVASGNPQAVDSTWKMVNTMVDKEVQRQMLDLEMAGNQANNAYSKLMDRYGEREQARDALRALMMNATQAELASMTAQTADPNINLWSQQMQQKIDEELLSANDAFAARAHGNVSERWQQGRAATRGGMRRMTMKEQMDWREHRSKVSGQQANTQKTYQEMMATGGDNEIAYEESLRSIPQSAKNELLANEESIAMFDRIVKEIGAEGYDPSTGKVHGMDRVEDAPGMGMLDRASVAMGFGSDRDRNVVAMRKELENVIVRARAGANLTEGETRRESGIRQALLEGNDRLAVQLLGEQLASRKATNEKVLLSPGQRRAYNWSSDAYRQESPIRQAGQGLSSNIPGAKVVGRF